jgi:hypothetical protein
MAGFSEDDIKYIQAIQDYMGYRLKGLPEFFYKTKDLNPSRRVRDTYTIDIRGPKPEKKAKGGVVGFIDGGSVKGKRFIARGCGAVMSNRRKKTLYT